MTVSKSHIGVQQPNSHMPHNEHPQTQLNIILQMSPNMNPHMIYNMHPFMSCPTFLRGYQQQSLFLSQSILIPRGERRVQIVLAPHSLSVSEKWASPQNKNTSSQESSLAPLYYHTTTTLTTNKISAKVETLTSSEILTLQTS